MGCNTASASDAARSGPGLFPGLGISDHAGEGLAAGIAHERHRVPSEPSRCPIAHHLSERESPNSQGQRESRVRILE
jgi:hypothetical protein